MARGQVGAAEKQLGTTNAVAGQQGAEAQQLESQLIPGYTSLMDTGYMDPAEEAAATTAEMGAATAPFESAGFNAKNEASATHNAAGLASQEDQLAREEGQAAGGAAANLEEQKLQNQEQGMYGLSNLEAGNQKAMEDMYGLGPGTLEARAAGPGWAQGFKDFSTGLLEDTQAAQNVASMAAGGCWIAAALYGGWDDPRTVDVRRWLNTEFVKRPIGRAVMALYLRFGKQIARRVERSKLLQAIFRPLFDLALRKARG